MTDKFAVEISASYDQYGNPLGGVPRSEVMHPKPDGPFGGSGNVLLRRIGGGRFGVARRAGSKKNWPGAWDFPGSGMEDAVAGVGSPGEGLRRTAARETREELRIECPEDAPRKVAAWNPGMGLGFHTVGVVFVLDVTEEDIARLSPNPADIEEIVWMTWEELEAAARDPTTLFKPDFRTYVLNAAKLGGVPV